MAAVILILAGAAFSLELVAMRNMQRTSLRDARVTEQPRRDAGIEDLLARTTSEITALLDLQACWFEPFPFDALLPRIEAGRIVLPVPEPGVAPWSDAGVELPVRLNGLTIGRFVLQPNAPTAGVVFPPTARERARETATQLAEPLAAALIRGDAQRLRGSSGAMPRDRSPA